MKYCQLQFVLQLHHVLFLLLVMTVLMGSFTCSLLFKPWYMEHITFPYESTHLTIFIFDCLLNNPSTEPKLTTKTKHFVTRVQTEVHNTSYALFHNSSDPTAMHTWHLQKNALYLIAYITLLYSIPSTYYTIKLHPTGIQFLLYPYILLHHMHISTVRVEISNLITVVNNPFVSCSSGLMMAILLQPKMQPCS